VIAERRQTLVTKRSEFPEELLFKDANAEIFKVQRKENIESFDEYESGKTNIYVKGRLNNSFSFWENIGTSDFIDVPIFSQKESELSNLPFTYIFVLPDSYS
jgi:hypothetical protein